MSKLWPEGNDVTLIKLIGDYMSSLSKNESVDEDTRESLGVAVDCLSSITQGDNVTFTDNNNDLTLTQMYEQCINNQNKESESKNEDNTQTDNNSAANKESNDNDNGNDSKTQSNSTLSAEELKKRLDKFEQFVKVLKSKNFFKNSKEGSEEYLKLLDTARTQWNQRFPQLTLDSLELITNAEKNNAKNQELAAKAKADGNAALKQKDFKTAIAKYTEAIKLDSGNAIYYSNRAAAYCYIKDYKQASVDARKATEVDPKYVKAWVRLGTSEFELQNYEEAQNAYNQALQLTPATDKNWEKYMESVQLCEQKLNGGNANDNDANDSGGANNGMPDLSQLGNMFGNMGGGGGGGGAPDLGNMFQNMGGMEGLSKIMENPMMQQMAQNLMKDPNMMNNLQNMMGGGGMPGGMPGGGGMPDLSQLGNMFGNMGGGGGGGAPAAAANDNSGGGGGGAAPSGIDDDMKDAMSKLLSDPQKAQEVMKKAMEDDEVKELMGDPTVEPLITRIKNGDYTALMEASQKPQLMAKVKKLMKKYT